MRCQPTGKIYIGQTSRSIEVRWKQHVAAASRGSRYPLHQAIREHGAHNFYPAEYAIAFGTRHGNRIEEFLIRLYKSSNSEFGYNSHIRLGGPTNRGKKRSPETIAKLRLALSRPEVKARIQTARLGNRSRTGMKNSPELLEKQRKGLKRFFSDPINCKKFGDAHRGRKGAIPTEEVRNRIAATLRGRVGSNKGRTFSEQAKARMSAAAKARILKFGVSFKGRHHTPETKQKISNSKKANPYIRPQEVCKRVAALLRGRKSSAESNLKRSIARIKYYSDPANRIKASIIQKNRKRNPSTVKIEGAVTQ